MGADNEGTVKQRTSPVVGGALLTYLYVHIDQSARPSGSIARGISKLPVASGIELPRWNRFAETGTIV
jgi:hypothetical protein